MKTTNCECENKVQIIKEKRKEYSLEIANARDFVPRVDNGGSSALGPHQHNVDHVRCRGHRVQLLEVVHRHFALVFSPLDANENNK